MSSEARRGARRAPRFVPAIAAAVAAAISIAGCRHAPGGVEAPERVWSGTVASVGQSGRGSAPGFVAFTAAGERPLAEGAAIRAGARLATDGRTRARVELEDGTSLVLDRATELAIEDAPRRIVLTSGAVLVDVAAAASPAVLLTTPHAEAAARGAKLAVTATPERTLVDVLRGQVEAASRASGRRARAGAGEQAVILPKGEIDVAPSIHLAQRASFEELAPDDDPSGAPPSGLGELRAKRPGRAEEVDRAVRLKEHAVKVRIAGNVARTEIDETFANDSDDELEGIYRFPLPPGAQIERLALEVDGELIEGEFVEKGRASAIWRGAIRSAAPKAPKPKEEIVWVPGPWDDPALLEWKRGGRFELRIFPIPKRGSRRVVIAYTETVPAAAGVRRYVYPLPRGASSGIEIERFTVDAQVLGHDASVPVRARGYELDERREGGGLRLAGAMTSFVPSGDLSIEYALDDRDADATAWAYREPPLAASPKADPIGGDPFVAIALRPKLPRWSEARPRDQVIVVDAGRAMFGERFARARRLAARMIQEMDRRDRVTVLACDVTCRALPRGFVGPGAPSAHDADAFLRGIEPEGASDLVGAIRAAAALDGRDPARELRVSLLSDGVATAGYRSAGRVAPEVGDALPDPRAFVVAVPIGSDADVPLLSEIARGGGGVVVPYQPGHRVEVAALEILTATYGTMLRDVELTLPAGLRDVAPAALAPIRAGGEIVVAARMSGELVRGDAVLRGEVGGERFEARYPLELRATEHPGNAFVPRLFAAARVADREREESADATAELVALSRRFSVPSRATSLLVLESEAMFDAFGIARADRRSRWTGEATGYGATAKAEGGEDERDDFDELAWSSAGPARPASAAAPKMKMMPKPFPPSLPGGGGVAPAAPPRPTRRMAGGRFMKRVYERRAIVRAYGGPVVSEERLAKAREELAAAPDERAKHQELSRLLARSGKLGELGEVLARWSERDPLDAGVIIARAELAARTGERERSLRVLSGALSASALSDADAFALAQAIGRSYERLGKGEACAFYVAAAELRGDRADARARAVACERARSRHGAAERWLAGSGARRRAVEAAVAKLRPGEEERAWGEITASARWDGDEDLDVAIIDPKGRRSGVVSAMSGARVAGATAAGRETTALARAGTGAYVVEVGRAHAGEHVTPVRGTLTVRALGRTATFPFSLAGSRSAVARIDVRYEATLVPVPDQARIPRPPVRRPEPR